MNDLHQIIEQLMCETCRKAQEKESVDREYCRHRKPFCYDAAAKVCEAINKKFQTEQEERTSEIEYLQQEVSHLEEDKQELKHEIKRLKRQLGA